VKPLGMQSARSHVPAVAAAAAGYARVSTADQSREGVSLDAQADRIARYCEAHGLSLAHIYIDAGVSGGTPLAQRPEGANLLAAIGRRDLSTVVALKLDRLFRSTLDCLQVVQLWDRQRIGLHLIDFNGGTLDTRSAMGRFFLTMAAGFGEMERALIGERTSAALQHMKRQGVRLGGVPYGFTASYPGGPLEPNDAELETVGEILRLRGTGDTLASYRAIARHLTCAGRPTRHGGPWQPETVRRIVERRSLYQT
jgi:DNA invertase Pin-like site-specific DNA recombinase